MQRISIVGGGPAGLRAAEVAAEAGAQVTLFEAARSVGRKFLLAGRNGLNLTNGEGFESFLTRYRSGQLPTKLWHQILESFNSDALRDWAAGLGVETYVASSGKVLPVPVDGKMRATPLLRAWLERLESLGVEFRTGHRWVGFDREQNLVFERRGERQSVPYDAAILALGGASWPKTGSDGAWTTLLGVRGVQITPLSASNCGWEVDWPREVLEEAEGLPLKNLQLGADGALRRGELVITKYGLEGAPIYRLGPAIRKLSEPHVIIDFKPDQSRNALLQRMGDVRRNFVREARRRLNLDPGTCALLKFLPDRGPWKYTEQLVDEIKHCRVDLIGPRPIEEAISTAGGIRWDELDEHLMIKRLPGVFVAGEMIDWDAPTGGYLLQACFATGTFAGRACIARSDSSGSDSQ